MTHTAPTDTALRAAVEAAGWVVAAIDEGDVWWCRALWRLRSSWRPQDREAFLCFLIEPQESSRTPSPWVVKVSTAPPTTWMERPDEFAFGCSGNPRRWIPAVVRALATLRNRGDA
jgi:hypothetical protein